MKLGIVTIAYNQAEPLVKMADSAVGTTGHDVQFHLFLHSRDRDTAEACRCIESNYDTEFYPLERNAGVACSWNSGILSALDHDCNQVLICNDDILFTPGDIDAMVEAADVNPARWSVFCSGWVGSPGSEHRTGDHGMACFILNQIAIDTLGMFDQNFFPAYNEDLDYARRADLAGLERITLRGLNIHHLGSATIKAAPSLRRQNHMTHEQNDIYWSRKWGAKKPEARFKVPFNRPRFHPYYIPPQDRYAPYFGYNREDQEIVKI